MPKKSILKRYDRTVYDEPKCERCDNLPYRHNDICDACPAFIGRYRFFSQQEAKKGIWSVPQGDSIAILRALRRRYGDALQVVDRRERIPFKHPIKFTGRLYREGDLNPFGLPAANQVEVARSWWKHKNGIISAPPRTGKTVTATAIYCKFGQKTVIIASQKEWLKQFYETATGRTVPRWRGNKKLDDGQPAQRRKAVTNIPELRERTGKEIIRYIDKFSQLENAEEDYDIVLITYQALMRDPERIVKYINNRYSLCIVDEQHRGNAHGFLKVLAQLNVAARLSLTATDKRKDSRDLFGEIIMGPVVAETKTIALVPHIYFENSEITIKPMPKRWPTVYKKICYHKERNRKIVRRIFEDLRDGHKVIIVPVDYIEHIRGLVKMINRQARINNKKRGEDWPIELAKEFHRKTDRDAVIRWVDSNKWDVPNYDMSRKERGPAPRVLVARASMIREGLDFARPTCIHLVLPLSANARAGSPLFYQMVNRVCTPIKGKRQPIVRIWVDAVDMFKTALSGLFWHEIFPNSQLKNKLNNKYYVPPQQMAAFKAFTAKNKTNAWKNRFTGSWL